LTNPDYDPREELRRATAEKESARQTHGFDSIIGQDPTVRRLKEFAALYAQTGAPPANVLLIGPSGIGKLTIGRAFALEYCGKLTVMDAKEHKRPGDLMGVLTNLGEGDALLIREIARTPQSLVDMLGRALKGSPVDFVVDKGMFAKTITVPLKRFTCIATAESIAKCPRELVELFPLILPLQTYSDTGLAAICSQLVHEKGIAITPAAAHLVAAASARTPHDVEVLVDRLVGLGITAISEEHVAQVSSVLGYGTGSFDSSSPVGMDTLSGVNFEKVIAVLLRKIGFHTEMTEVTGDGGIDIVATLNQPLIGGRYLIQCKRFAADKLVGAATVRDFYGALTADRRAGKGILITTSSFSAQAIAFAEKLPIELIGGQKLQELLTRYGISAEIQDAAAGRDGGLFE
jgi:Holliday junction resolvasome RuvABC ATP-dependent DNA helicase subunit